MTGSFNSHNLDRNHKGVIEMEVPLTSRHIANIQYELNELKEITTGNCNVLYNQNKVLDGKYKCKVESRAGFSKEITEISLDNAYYPAGIAYIHQTEYEDKEYPFFDMKRAELYELKNSKRFNITGELHVKTTSTGQTYKVIAIHPNRTVVVTSDYDYQNTTLNQRLKLLLSSDMWIAYDFKLTNLTTSTNDSQLFSIDMQYPKRNLSTTGWYSITDDVFDSDLSFRWTKSKKKKDSENNNYDDYGQLNESDEDEDGAEEKSEERNVKAALTWKNEPLSENDKCNQTVLLVIKHPSFRKDVTFNANYYRNDINLVHGTLVVDYHDDPEHLLMLEGGIMDSSQLLNHRNYSIFVTGQHQQTEFKLDAMGSVAAKSSVYQTKNFGKYKRGYLPLQEGILNAGIDLPRNDLHYRKVSPHKEFYLWVRANGEYPIYTVNGTYEDSQSELNTTAEFYVNIDNRFIRVDANFTPDASQNLRLLGVVPDARSAKFDLWRDYEDIRIVDVAYYLRLNHSRLITSQLIWRPKLRNELKASF